MSKRQEQESFEYYCEICKTKRKFKGEPDSWCTVTCYYCAGKARTFFLCRNEIDNALISKAKVKEAIGKLREDYENWKGNGDKGISDMSSEGYEFDVLDLIEKRLGL
jgi:hypothetical protein